MIHLCLAETFSFLTLEGKGNETFPSAFTPKHYFCAFGNDNASEIPAGEASDRKRAPQAAAKMHDAFDFKGPGTARPKSPSYTSRQEELSGHHSYTHGEVF